MNDARTSSLFLRSRSRVRGFVVLAIAGWAGVSGCGKWEEAQVPHWIVVPVPEVVVEAGEGTANARIEEVWVYTETRVLGAFPLPARIPVLPAEEGENVTLTFLPGIRANGVAATRKPYPFYEAFRQSFGLREGAIDTLTWSTGYVEGAFVQVAEDFENANRFVAGNTSTAEMVRTTDPEWVREGVGSGFCMLDDSHPVLYAMTNEQQYALPDDGAVWMEFEARGDIHFAIGIAAFTPAGVQRVPILIVAPTDGEWKKFYLDLGPVVRSVNNALWWEITLDAALEPGATGGRFALDNLKLVGYP